jgi:hypothetical protein
MGPGRVKTLCCKGEDGRELLFTALTMLGSRPLAAPVRFPHGKGGVK